VDLTALQRLSPESGPTFGVGGVDILHRGLGGNAEDAHEMDWVGGVAGFVEDAVLAELGRAQAQGPENVVHDHGGDGREPVVGDGLLADQEVGVGRQRPPLVTVAEPVAREDMGAAVSAPAAERDLAGDGPADHRLGHGGSASGRVVLTAPEKPVQRTPLLLPLALACSTLAGGERATAQTVGLRTADLGLGAFEPHFHVLSFGVRTRQQGAQPHPGPVGNGEASLGQQATDPPITRVMVDHSRP
jgi:hypothetical protein